MGFVRGVVRGRLSRDAAIGGILLADHGTLRRMSGSPRGYARLDSPVRPDRPAVLSVHDRQQRMSENAMNPEDLEDDLRPEYDFDLSKGVRGKYYQESLVSQRCAPESL
jgi:hypothetical protein